MLPEISSKYLDKFPQERRLGMFTVAACFQEQRHHEGEDMYLVYVPLPNRWPAAVNKMTSHDISFPFCHIEISRALMRIGLQKLGYRSIALVVRQK